MHSGSTKAKRAGTYLTLPSAAVRHLLEAGALTREAAVLLVLWDHRSDGTGDAVLSSWPRELVAMELGISSKAVSKAISGLAAKGMVKKLSGGFKGAASVYRLMPDFHWPLLKGTPETDTFSGADDAKGTPHRGQRYPSQGPKGTPHRGTQQRDKEIQRARDGADVACATPPRADRRKTERTQHDEEVQRLIPQMRAIDERLKAGRALSDQELAQARKTFAAYPSLVDDWARTNRRLRGAA